MGVYQAGLHLVEARICRIDVLFLDLHLVVFLAPGTVVGPCPWLRLWVRLVAVGAWSRFIGSSDWRSLFLRLVLLYLRQAFDDIALLLLLLILPDEQFTQLGDFKQKLIHLAVCLYKTVVGLPELLLEEGNLLLEHTDNLVLFHAAKVRKKNETTKEKPNYF